MSYIRMTLTLNNPPMLISHEIKKQTKSTPGSNDVRGSDFFRASKRNLSTLYSFSVILRILLALSVGAGLGNTPTASLLRGKTPPTNVQDMTLNSLMVRFQ